MDDTRKRREAAASLGEARRALSDAYNLMHTARARLEELHPGTDEFLSHQSDSGALWALASQLAEMRRTVNRIIKVVTPEESG